jgi:hypothetical protein
MSPGRGRGSEGRVYIAESPIDSLDPEVHLFEGVWERDEGLTEMGPGWSSLDDAVAWGRARAPGVILRIGRSGRQVLFSAGEVNRWRETEHIPDWPPSFADLQLIERQLASEVDDHMAAEIAAKVAAVRQRVAEFAAASQPAIIQLEK